MEWSQWAPVEARIRAEFGYAEADDAAAARSLWPMVPRTNRFRDLGVEVRNRRNVAVLGCGPSLVQTPVAQLADQVLVAADGACGWLRESGLVPHLVVTDLDGAAQDLAWAADAGAAMVVHAHGDNRPALRVLVPRLGPRVYGTHQGPPDPGLEPMRNVGGFTDGDRAVVLCEHLGARQATLHGFDFEAEPSSYSHKWDPRTKPRKLAWAKSIIEGVHARGALRVVLYRP